MDKKLGLVNQNVRYGLIGKNIPYSFSKQYFTQKFSELNIVNCEFNNFDLASLEEFPYVLKEHQNLKGLSVTIPYKQEILKYLDEVSEEALALGAVNSIKIINKKLIGYNTDIYGFEDSFKPLLLKNHQKAIVLGTGGASKAIKFVLHKLAISFISVSRNPKNKEEISYQQLTEEFLKLHQIIINCTPVGTFPQINEAPELPYHFINHHHYLFDLIYNPSETLFLQKGKQNGAITKNGLDMLKFQADKSWEIWNSI